MSKKIIFHKKDFLNKEGHLSDASIYSSVIYRTYEDDEESVLKRRSYYDTEFKIRDCSNSVYIDLELDGTDKTDNTIHKLNVLISHITELRDAILNLNIDDER
jgi:hypothetical protein